LPKKTHTESLFQNGSVGRASLPASRCFRQVQLGRSLALPLQEPTLSPE